MVGRGHAQRPSTDAASLSDVLFGRNPVRALLKGGGRRTDEIAVLAGAAGPLAAMGAADSVRVARETNLAAALEKLKQAGVWIHGAAAPGGVAPWDADLTGPLCLVLGSEGGGLRPLIARTCDVLLTVPMLGQVGSLNVSAATAVICYEVVRQRHARRKLLT